MKKIANAKEIEERHPLHHTSSDPMCLVGSLWTSEVQW